ncbi:MAG: diguanylate cyclase [Thermoanaerobaculales bacterium]
MGPTRRNVLHDKKNSENPHTVIVVEDNEELNHLIQNNLNRVGLVTQGVATGVQAVAAAVENPEAVLLLEYLLPDMTAKDVVADTREKGSNNPFVILTDHSDAKTAVEMMKLGARDYIVKDTSSYDILPHIVKRIIHELSVERELINAEKQILEKQEDLSALYTVSTAISQTIDIKKLLTIVLETVTELKMLNVEREGGIFLVEDDRMELVAHLGHSEGFLELHRSMRVGDCLCGIAAEKGEVLVSSNCHHDARHTIKYPEMAAHGHIILPLRAGKRTIGVLYLYQPAGFEIPEGRWKLLDSICNQIGIAIENARLYEETKRFSLHDALTGLANRRMMQIDFRRSFSRAKRNDDPFSVIMLDIDRFKKYNDSHGHSAGDQILVKLAEMILNETREMDLCVRYGGEEFLIILPDTDLAGAQEIAERIRASVAEKLDITVSLGVSSFFAEMIDYEELIKKVDDALYRSKNLGRNRVEIAG